MRFNKLNKELLLREYSLYKNKAQNYFNNGHLSKSIKCIEYCGLIAWHTPVIREFCDNDLEKLITDIRNKHHPMRLPVENRANRIVFYNSQIIDNGALTEQYLNYFIQQKYEVLFIVPDIKNIISGTGILKIIQENPLITLFIPNFNDPLNKIQTIEDEIVQFCPQKAFLHFIPNDIVGFGSFCSLRTIKRYYIVHNDHTFWFGKTCSDYFIEFRKFGYLVATQRRGIDISKIFHLPYYPIKQDIPFQGFPFDIEGKVIGFSAAQLYKYYFDPELKYFKAIKELIFRNPSFIFCLAGYGNTEIVEQFIRDNHLQDRFFFLGKRDDFYELINNIDILFESYPFKGGLTVLYGVENHKAITGIGDNRNASGCLEDFFDLTSYKQPQNFEDFFIEADQIIKSKEARKFNAAKFKYSKYNKNDFESGLSKIIKGILPADSPIYDESLKLDDEIHLNEYLKLPYADFEFYNKKLFELKSLIPVKGRISIFIYLLKFNPNLIKKRIGRYMILVLFGR